MTLLNHIGVFVLLFLIWNTIAIIIEKGDYFKDLENLSIALKITIIFYVFYELFYWTFKIFF